MATQVSYAGIQFDNILTKAISTEPVLSDDKVDVLYTHITVEIRALINAALFPALPDETATQTLRRIRACLMQERKQFNMAIANEPLITSPLAGNITDSKLGPHPMYCNVSKVAGDQTFMVDFGIETWLSECPNCNTAGSTPAPVPTAYVSHRWSETHEFDDKFYMKRTLEGKIVLRAEALLTPESLVGLVFAAIPPGFERRESRYMVQEDGLALAYRYSDQEVYKVTPAPAARWTGSNILSTANGASFTQEIVVKLEGAKGTSKVAMVGAANAIIVGLLPPFATSAGNPHFVVAGSMMELLHENVIEVRAKIVNQIAPPSVAGWLQASLLSWDTIPGVDKPGLPFIPKAVNYAANPLGLQVAPPGNDSPIGFLTKFIDDPCLQAAIALQLSATPVGNRQVNGSVAATVDVTPTLPTANGSYNVSELSENSPYNDYVIETSYVTDYHVLQLPLATSSSPTTAFATMAQPTMTKVVRWTTERMGNQPTIPDPTVFDSNNVLLSDKVMPQAPWPLADGNTMIWRISGEYVYGLKEAANTVYQAGVYPFMSWSNTTTDLEEEIFSDTIIESQGGIPIPPF